MDQEGGDIYSKYQTHGVSVRWTRRGVTSTVSTKHMVCLLDGTGLKDGPGGGRHLQ